MTSNIATPRCDDLHLCRSLPSIIFSCASTILLCTWVAFHPDVPKNPKKPSWKRLLRRIGQMIMGLLAPEGVLTWAMMEWAQSSASLKELLKKYPESGWTETHAMFARMGEFRLAAEDDMRGKPLYDKEFFEMAIKGEIELPEIDEEEVEDRGKSDSIAKSITVIQTLWFAIQAAHRVGNGLDVTELELTTLAHVVLNMFIYWCWWNKPLNVRFPIDVRRRKSAEGDQDPTDPAEKDPTPALPLQRESPIEGDGAQQLQVEEASDVHNNVEDQVEEVPTIETEQDHESQTPSKTQTIPRIPFRVRMGAVDENEPGSILIFILYIVVTPGLFGAIHCLAWNSYFPNHTEQILWRVCSVIVAVAPAPCLAITAFATDATGVMEKLLWTLEFLFLLAYCVARICLLVLALVTLRNLPYKAYVAPSWTFYVPHIG